jgi:copper chaperone CopZ
MSALTMLVLKVPGLIERPAVGSSCCVTPAEALVAQELWMLPGIDDTLIDERAGRVTVSFDSDLVSMDDILGALADVGYPAQVAVA